MEADKLVALVEVFEGLEDWRNAQQTRHRLDELLTVAVCAVLSGADDFEDISQWGKEKLDWLRCFLTLDYAVWLPPTPSRGCSHCSIRRASSAPFAVGSQW